MGGWLGVVDEIRASPGFLNSREEGISGLWGMGGWILVCVSYPVSLLCSCGT